MNEGIAKENTTTDSDSAARIGATWWVCTTRFVAAAVACTLAESAAIAAELAYDTQEIDVGESDYRTLLVGRLTGGATEDLVVFASTAETKRVAVYAHDGDAFSRAHLAELADDIFWVDIIELAGGAAIVTTRAGRIDRIDPAKGTVEPLVSLPSAAGRSDEAGDGGSSGVSPLTRWDFTRDLTGDGLDDILFPVSGLDIFPPDSDLNVLVQRPDGGFADPVVLSTVHTVDFRIGYGVADAPVSIIQIGDRGYIWSAAHRLDHDGDGIGDLAVPVDGGLAVHRGTGAGIWAAEPFRVPFEAVSMSQLNALIQQADGELVVRPMLLDVDDFNGDGTGDVIAVTVDEEFNSRYDFHFGRRESGRTVFGEAVDTSIAVDGVIALSELSDLDGDGDWDFCAVPLKVGVGTVLSGLFRRSVRVDLNCYQMEGDVYPGNPSRRWSITYPTTAPAPNTFADLTGDGILDAVVPARGGGLDVYPGTGDGDLFTLEPIGVEVDLPSGLAGEVIWFRDLNRDGRADMLIVPPESGQPVWVALSR